MRWLGLSQVRATRGYSGDTSHHRALLPLRAMHGRLGSTVFLLGEAPPRPLAGRGKRRNDEKTTQWRSRCEKGNCARCARHSLAAREETGRESMDGVDGDEDFR
eukprot:CAMPEP_0167805428 /NCGR_PEP_ID=MMETSP0111_2-20121227/21170_1 /TAXON_ID=91324 /ORGANISM="Lotharella globosa, Strain CCCM811" /LENGTH=103 /DNA_ID=CAMNT_0007702575 /DNA_START=1 /DNA_END=312 /DNA_ORIENTATION=+